MSKEHALTPEQERTCERLLDKSQEAFILAIELFNRPTIRYRVEGCAFFLCNAWELMLKAYIAKRDGYRAIFYPGNNRTLALEDCLKKVMTNDKDPVRANVESIGELRNTSTHFVVEEYEITYGPIFQANIRNYDDRLRTYHGIEICDRIPDNYLVLSVNRTDLDGQSIRAKYTPEVAERLLSTQNAIDARSAEESNMKYAAYFRTEFMLSKKDGIPIRVDNSADSTARIISRTVDPTQRYPFRMKEVLSLVNRQLRKRHIRFTSRGDQDARFNNWHFSLFSKCYGMKQDERFAFNRASPAENRAGHPYYIYSNATVDFIVGEIAKDPEHIVEKLNRKVQGRKHD
ncbi:DUF3644 domain-containing protein [Bifidobacterium primatium]|nr:DUF3644 domain-containing protein [Bifidobacterium primatium]